MVEVIAGSYGWALLPYRNKLLPAMVGVCPMQSHHNYWDLLVAMAFRARDAICTNWAPKAQHLQFGFMLAHSHEKDLPNLRDTPGQRGATSLHVHSRDSEWNCGLTVRGV